MSNIQEVLRNRPFSVGIKSISVSKLHSPFRSKHDAIESPNAL